MYRLSEEKLKSRLKRKGYRSFKDFAGRSGLPLDDTTLQPRVPRACRTRSRPVESRRSAVACRTGGAEYAQRLSLLRSPRNPSLRFGSPLIEPGVQISRTRLSDGFHAKACAGGPR